MERAWIVTLRGKDRLRTFLAALPDTWNPDLASALVFLDHTQANHVASRYHKEGCDSQIEEAHLVPELGFAPPELPSPESLAWQRRHPRPTWLKVHPKDETPPSARAT